MKSLPFIVLIVISFSAFAQPRVVKDINDIPSNFSDQNSYPIAAGDFAFFSHQDPFTYEVTLWVTDGTPAGTHAIEGTEGFLWISYGRSDGAIFYTKADADHSWLYFYNAHNSTSIMLHEFDEGIAHAPIVQFLTSGDITFFAWSVSGSNDVEFWKSDGTIAGTEKFKTITGSYEPGSWWSATTADGSRSYFTLFASPHNEELWVTDGTDAGTMLLRTSSSFYENISDMRMIDDVLYFGVYDMSGTPIGSFWRSDGTAATTIKLKDIPGAIPNSTIRKVNGTILFSDGTDLYESDGTENGTTVLVADQNIFSANVLNGTYYGLNMKYNPDPAKLIKSDGTAGGTMVAADLGTPDYPNSSFQVLGNKLILTGQQSDTGTELFVSDGTSAGTSILKDIFPGIPNSQPNFFTPITNRVLFIANDGIHGEELWVTDGTTAGTQLLFDVEGTKGSLPSRYDDIQMGVTNGKLTFAITGKRHYNERDLWITDGTEANTKKVFDGGGFSSINYLGELNGEVYYSVGYKIIKVSGQTMQSTVVKDYESPTVTGVSGSSRNPATINGKIIYYNWITTTTGSVGLEPYVTDGTDAGTKLLKDINPGSGGSIWYGWGIVLNNKFIFSAGDASNGEEVWATDGTTAGTVMLKDINPGTAPSYPDKYVVFDNKIFFVAYDGVSRKLYSTDGTSANTQVAADIFSDAFCQDVAVMGNSLYILVTHNTDGWQLWKSDGTAANTTVVRTLSTSTDPYDQSANFNVIGDKIYLMTGENHDPHKLWSSDGTDAGTILIKSVTPGPGEELSGFIADFNGVAYFWYNGYLWKTNGTPEVTEQVARVRNGTYFTYIDNQIYYLDGTYDYGVELFVLPLTRFHQTIAMDAIPAKTMGDVPFDVSATVSTALPLTFTSSDHVTVSGNTLTIIKPGKATITAHQGGNGDFEPAEVSDEFCINPVKPVITSTTLSNGVPQLHSSAADGTMWYLAGMAVGDGKDLTVSSSGSYTAVVTVEGCASVVSDVTVVTKLGQTITFAQPNVDFTSGSINLNATTTSGLPLTYSSSSDKISIAGGTASILKAGTVTVKATQGGNDLYLTAEKSVSFCINPSKPVITKKEDHGSSAVLESSAPTGNQWYKEDVLITGATLQTLNVSESGVYNVMVDVEGCKSDMSEDIIQLITGIESGGSTVVYPNPVSEKLYVEVGNDDEVTAMVFSGVGKEMVKMKFVGRGVIDVGTWPVGIYLVKILKGDRAVVRKFARE